MKKLVLAAAIAAIAGNAMAAEVYSADDVSFKVFGEIRTRLQSVENDDEGTKFDMGSSKLGAQVDYTLSEDLTATGYLKYKADLNDSGEVKVSSGWIGLSSNQFGTAKIGKVATVHDSMFGGYDASTLYGGNAKLGEDEYGTDTIESGLTYTWSNDSFTVMTQVSLADEDVYEADSNLKDYKGKIDKTYALGGSWTSGFGLTLATAYTVVEADTVNTLDDDDNITDNQIAKFGKDAELTALGFEADYSIGAWTVGAAVFQHEFEADKKEALDRSLNTFGMGVAYQLDNGVKLFGGYDVLNSEDNNTKAESDTTSYNFGAEYRPISNIKTFAEFKSEKVDPKGGKSTTSDSIGIGARVYF